MNGTSQSVLERGRTWLAAALGVLTIGVICLFMFQPVNDYDIWWHLFFGREMLAHFTLPTVDQYTLLGMGRPYHDSHWLFQVVMGTGFRLAGLGWLYIYCLTLWGMIFWFTYRSSRDWTTPAGAWFLLLLTALTSEKRFIPRPEVVSILMVSVFCWRLQRGRWRTLPDVALFVALQVIWTNCHGIFVVGPLLVGCYLVAALVDGLRGKGYGDARALAGLLLALAAACLVNPYGWGSYRYAWLLFTEVGQSASPTMQSIGELAKTFSRQSSEQSAFWFFLLLVAGFVVSWLMLLVFNRRQLSMARTLSGCGMLVIAYTAIRNIPLFAVVAAPIIAQQWGALPSNRLRRIGAVAVAAVLLTVSYVWSPWQAREYLFSAPSRVGLGFSRMHYPLDLPSLLEQVRYSGQVFNSASLGGFYLYHSFPARVPFFDGRMEVYDREFLEQTQATIYQFPEAPQLWADFSRKYDFRGLLLQHMSPEAEAVLPLVMTDPGWRLVYLDYAASFWLRSDSAQLPPAVDASSRVTALAGRAPGKESALLIDWFVLKAHLPPELRIPALRRVLRFAEWPALLETLGDLEIRTGDLVHGEQTLRRLLGREPTNKTALRGVSLAAFLRNDLATAESLLQQGLKAHPGDADLLADLARAQDAGKKR